MAGDAGSIIVSRVLLKTLGERPSFLVVVAMREDLDSSLPRPPLNNGSYHGEPERGYHKDFRC